MSRAMRMKITGTRRMQQKLEAMPERVRAELEGALAEGADEIVAMQKRLVPVGQGELRDSIRWERGRVVKRQRRLFGGGRAREMDTRNLSVTIFTDDWRARFVEFGTVAQPARAFFFPAYRALKRRIVLRIRRRMRKAVREVARGRAR